MKYTILLVLLCFHATGFAQADSVANSKNKTEILRLLRAGNLNELNSYFKNKENEFTFFNEFRDRRVEVTPGYFASVVSFLYEKRLADQSTQSYASVKIDVIAKDSTLIYWKFEYYDCVDTINIHVDSFVNNRELSNIKSAFLKTYKTPLKTANLFEVYGCFANDLVGEGGIYTDDWKKIMTLIKKKDVRTLRTKLRSGRIYDQLFAVAGFAELKKKNYPIDKETNEIIKQIRSKKGSVMVMQGCILHEMKISEVVTEMIKWH